MKRMYLELMYEKISLLDLVALKKVRDITSYASFCCFFNKLTDSGSYLQVHKRTNIIYRIR